MINEIKSTLNFINNVMAEEQRNYEYFFEFVEKYDELYRKLEYKLPYHINVIDELHANENAHSRILAKLLQQNANNRFEVLESFIEYLSEQKSALFYNIKVEDPVITQETGRIDLWIRDKTYSIIVENKIHYASDQDRQLERYIDKTKQKGYTSEQIFIVYLSPRYEEPDEQSWGEYRDEFAERYLNLSFSNDILQWLKDKVLPDVRHKDIFLKSAIEQYIDHLEGFFEFRTINNKVNMELRDFIKQELGLTGSLTDNLAKLVAKKEEINRVSKQIDSMITDATKESDKFFFKEWQTEMTGKYPDLQGVYNEANTMGLIVNIDNSTSVRVVISIDCNMLYCQIDMDVFENQDLPERVREKTKHMLPEKNNNNQIWKWFDRFDYDGVFACFQEVIRILMQK